MTLTRKKFIRISAGTLAWLAVGPRAYGRAPGRINGNIYDLLGFPVQGASVNFVTGFSLLADDGLHASKITISPSSTNSLGAFSLSLPNPDLNLALRVNYQNEAVQITASQITGTNIPFYNAQVWAVFNKTLLHPFYDPETKSRMATKWINDEFDQGLLSNLAIYIDPSRTFLKNYFSVNHKALFTELQKGSHIAEDKEPWEGNHEDPEHPGRCNENNNGLCDDHYYDPHLDGSKKINPPFGSGWGVIPFVCAEGTVFHVEDEVSNVSTDGSRDGDWEWDFIVEPQYGYLPNNENRALPAKYEPPTGKELALHSEMCNWFMGKKNADVNSGTHTSVSRNDNVELFIDPKRINKRVWMTGSWGVDSGHELHNEIHPVYWVVPFTGGWRRFYASEITRIYPTSNIGARTIINNQVYNTPATMLDALNANFNLALALKNRADAEEFYMDTIVHLNKFGLNSAFPKDATDVANSINKADFARQSIILSINQMAENIKGRYQIIYNHLTNLGSGFYVFPSMIFIYEGTDIIQQADAMGLHRPDSFITALFAYPNASRIQVALGKQLLLFGDSLIENGLTLLQMGYENIFHQMRSSGIAADKIADYYTKTAIRLISYGMYDDTDTQHPGNPQALYNWAISKVNANINVLIESTNNRLRDLWNDAFPFARRFDNKVD